VNKNALLIALGVAAIGAALLLLYLRRFEQETSGGAPVALLVASKPIEAGTLLSDVQLGVREIPAAYVETRAVRASEKQRVVGLRISTRIEPDQTLMWTDLAAAADDRRDLSGLVQPGMRAVTIRTRAAPDHANQLIQPGDRVDVILTTAEKAQESTIVLLQNVLVLAVGLDTGSDQGEKHGPGRDPALTVSVTIREAQIVSLASERGRISVALRNRDDVRIVDGLVETTSSALVDARTAAQRPAPVSAPAASGEPTPAPIRLEPAGVARRGARR
jgi:pilus assembly protein CpaB